MRSPDIEDKEPFFDPVLGDRVEAPVPWLEETPIAGAHVPLQSDLLAAAYHLRFGHQNRLQSLVSRSPLAFAVAGGFRA